jgi:hypothetical protein
MHGWDWYGLDKKRVRTRYAEPVFLHLVGFVGSGAFGARNVTALFFIVKWDQYGFDK